MSLAITHHPVISAPQPCCFCPTFDFQRICPADPSQTAFYEKQLRSITQKDWEKAKKIEFFNSKGGQWVEISPKTFGILMDLGLTEKRLDKLSALWTMVAHEYAQNSNAEQFIQFLLNYINSLFETKQKKSSEFWNLVENSDDKHIHSLISGEENCLLKGPNRPYALILETFGPDDPSFVRHSLFNIHLMNTLFKVYNICTRTFSSVSEFCSKTKEMTRAISTKLIMIKGHGMRNGYGMATYPDPQRSMTLYDSLTGCFDFIARNTTFILSSCYLGLGRSKQFNFANHLANSVPRGTHIIAPMQENDAMAMNPEEPPPHSVVFRNSTEIGAGIGGRDFPPYHIDTANPAPELCPPDAISRLDLCSQFPLLQLKQAQDKSYRPILYFYSATKREWVEVADRTWRFLEDRLLNNGHLEKISQSNLTLSEFMERAERYSYKYTGSDLVELIL
jgi:hypothetical protein